MELAGSQPLDDGRYLIRSGPAERVLVIETEGALPPARRRRRRPRKSVESESPTSVTVSVVTVIRADQPFDGESAAEAWLERLGDSEFTGELLDDAIGTLDRARAAEATASGVPFGTRTDLNGVLSARIGFGDGDQVASGRFAVALDVDARGGTASKRRERAARTGSLARTAAILGGRERASACEVLIPRIRLDLDTGNDLAACLVISAAAASTIGELEFTVEGEGHEEDLDRLEGMLPALEETSARARESSIDAADLQQVEEALTLAERVIRRRRILEQ